MTVEQIATCINVYVHMYIREREIKNDLYQKQECNICKYSTDIREIREYSVQFSHSAVSDFVTPWTAAHQASLSITKSWSLLKLMSIESVMPSNHLMKRVL